MGRQVSFPNKLLEKLKIGNKEIDSLSCCFLGLSDILQTRPYLFAEDFHRNLLFLEQVNDDKDNAGNKVVVFEKVE